MDVGLGIAGLLCVAMGLGHMTIGLRWVLPGIDAATLPATPFGSRSMTRAMIRITWHVVTIFATGVGSILLTLAWDPEPSARTLLLRGFAAMWLGATLMAAFVTRSAWRQVPRLPVPLLWMVVAALCWRAAA
jgi:hypothetical protein